jgi:transcription initiation factor TFIIIB Brf1 subunit/transcription initiation factor TFIIB
MPTVPLDDPMQCAECLGTDFVLNTTTADSICTNCGLCTQEISCGWEFPAFSALSHTTRHKKSVHDKNAYFKKKMDSSCPYLSSSMRQQLARLFKKAEHSFKRITSTRKYSPSYNYVCSQLLRILACDRLAFEVPRIKGARKLKELDATWQLVCKEAGWTFEPLFKWHPFS